MDAKELIASLAERLGFDLIGEDSWAFEADDLVVVIHHLLELDAFALTTDLGEPPPQRLEGLYKALLSANHLFTGTAGATLAVDSETDHVSLCRVYEVRHLDADSFFQATERFVNIADSWQKIIADYRESPSNASSEPLSSQSPFGNFLQV